jgi:hypothetical protein
MLWNYLGESTNKVKNIFLERRSLKCLELKIKIERN